MNLKQNTARVVLNHSDIRGRGFESMALVSTHIFHFVLLLRSETPSASMNPIKGIKGLDASEISPALDLNTPQGHSVISRAHVPICVALPGGTQPFQTWWTEELQTHMSEYETQLTASNFTNWNITVRQTQQKLFYHEVSSSSQTLLLDPAPSHYSTIHNLIPYVTGSSLILSLHSHHNLLSVFLFEAFGHEFCTHISLTPALLHISITDRPGFYKKVK